MMRSGKGNMFVKNLHKSFDNNQLHLLFSKFGSILSCQVARDASGVSKGHGFVQYESEASQRRAIAELHGAYIREQLIHVSPFVSRRLRDESPDFTNVYVKNLAQTATDDDLKKIFEEFGEITSAVVMRDAKGKSRKFGFVNFEKTEAAVTAIKKMNGTTVDEKELYVGRAQKKKIRVENLKAEIKFEKFKRDVRVLKGLNLYVKNLEDSVNDAKLQDLFSEFGTITSCKVMVDLNGKSKGVGFVEFSTSKEASEAMLKMHGKMVGRQPIYIYLAVRKEEQHPLHLQTQIHSVVSSSPRPNLHHPHIFSQTATSTRMLPPQLPPFGYNVQPQLMFGLPNSYPALHVPNFMYPSSFLGLPQSYF